MFRTYRATLPAVALATSVCLITGLAPRAGAGNDDPAFTAQARAEDWVADADGAAPADGAAQADESADPKAAPAAPKSKGIEEITVTGRRREEKLQSTPLSMVAISDEELQARQVTTITDIGETAANVKFDTTNGSNSTTRVFIRGVGQDDARSNVDPGVGIYVDGVYYPRAQGSVIGVNDVERIEILRGPQGTLFGKNTVGGVVQVVTKKPAPEFEGQTTLRYGKFDLLETSTSVNFPIVPEKAFARLAFQTQTDDGYLKNDFDSRRAGDNKLLGGRAALRALLTDDLTFDFTLERSKEREKNPVNECRIGSPFSQGRFFQDNFTNFVSQCNSTRTDGDDFRGSQSDVRRQDQDVRGATGTFTWALGDGTLTSISSWRQVAQRFKGTDLDGSGADSFGIGRGKFKNDTVSQEFQFTNKALDDKLLYQVGVYAFKEDGGGKIVLDSLNSLLRDENTPLRAASASNAQTKVDQLNVLRFVLDSLVTDPTKQLGQLSGPADLTFARLDETVSRAAALTPFLTTPGTADQISAAIDANSPTRLRDNVFLLNGTVLDQFKTNSNAIFGELTYDFTDKFSVTAGARFTTERRERSGEQIAFKDEENPRGIDINGDHFSDRFKKWTSRVQLSYQATDDIFAYTSYSRGFKSGGFNASVVAPMSLGAAMADPGKFDQEVVDAYEIGLKTQWLDNRLLLNLSGYYYQYDNIQITTIQINDQGTPVGQINNVADAVIQGLELDFQARPFGNLQLSGGLGLINDDYKNFQARVDTQTALFSDPRGMALGACQSLALEDPSCNPINQLQALGFLVNPGRLPVTDMSDLDRTNTPNFTLNLSADYSFDLGGWGQLGLRTTWYMQNKVFFSTNNDEDVSQNKYGLLNGRIAWTLWDDKTQLSLFGRNLLDRHYLDGGFSVEDTIGSKPVFFGRPRSYGVEIQRRF